MNKPVSTNNLCSAFGLDQNGVQLQPRDESYSIPPAGAKAVFDFNETSTNQFQKATEQAIQEERLKDDDLAQNFKQDNSINVSLARSIDTVNNILIIAQREAMRSQDCETLKTVVDAINAAQKLLSTLIEFRKQDQKFENAKALEDHKHKLSIEKMTKKAELNPPKGSIGAGKQMPLIGSGSGPIQVNINYAKEQALDNELRGKSIEDINKMQSSLGVKKLLIEYEDSDDADVPQCKSSDA